MKPFNDSKSRKEGSEKFARMLFLESFSARGPPGVDTIMKEQTLFVLFPTCMVG